MTLRRRPIAAGRAGVRAGVGVLLVLAALLTVALAGCNREPAFSRSAEPVDPAVGTVTTAPDGVQEITLQTQDNFVFLPDRFTVAPGEVRLTLLNAAEATTHNFSFTPGAGPEPIPVEIELVRPGQSVTVDFTVTLPGDYGFECSLHTRLRQFGTMTVSG